MNRFAERITVTSDKETVEYLNELAVKGNCSVSQAFRNMAADHKYLTARFAALGKRQADGPKWGGPEAEPAEWPGKE